MPREYAKRSSCRRGHPYRKGSFRVEVIRGYEVRRCLRCQNAWGKRKYQQDSTFREKEKARMLSAYYQKTEGRVARLPRRRIHNGQLLCGACGLLKPEGDFHVRADTGNRKSYCKQCAVRKAQERRKKAKQK